MVLATSGLAQASFVVALAALLWGIGWAIFQRSSDAKRDIRIGDIEAERTASIDAIGRAVAAGIDPAAAHQRGAAISIELHLAPSHPQTPDVYLVVRNAGPGGALVQTIEAINRPLGESLFGYVPPHLPIELLFGEEEQLSLNVLLATALPLEILVRWIDGTGTTKERIRTFTQWPAA